MAEINNPLSNLSYTNKDFQTIYPELLELVKKLTYKWDPTISNESDPGVILLKVNAILADKNNYNIDKNVLECFPLSVTQEKNAYQLFEQLGYRMKWYRAAGSTYTIGLDERDEREAKYVGDIVSIRWVGDSIVPETAVSTSVHGIIPIFSMVSNEDSSIVYTLLKEGSIRPTKGEIETFPAIQGIVTNYTINGEELIRYSNLDSHRRLYFDDYNVAENGIFISPFDSDEWFSWVRVDNIAVQPIGENKKYYKFGLSQDLDRCYIEFPENASELFGSGIKIKYIKTDGDNGNIPARELSQGFQITSINVTDGSEEESIDFSENLSIYNVSQVTNGYNPESIDEAYRNYTRTVGTFDTLVTLRDYLNAILLFPNQVSNGFVCDRTNDIQTTYKVMTKENGLNLKTTVIEESNDEPLLTAFDIKFYLLEGVDKTNTQSSYDVSFGMIDSTAHLKIIEGLIEQQKCIQHDYKYISDPTQYGTGNPCYFKNKYEIKCKIIPQYSLTKLQESEVRVKIAAAIYNAFNSKNINFGEEPSYEKIYETILNADQRIKSVLFGEDLAYETYVCYLTGSGDQVSWVEKKVSISNAEFESGAALAGDAVVMQKDIFAKSCLDGVTQLLEKDTDFDYNILQKSGAVYNNIKSVTTNANGSISNNTNIDSGSYPYSYTVQANETAQIIAPNYLEKTKYSTSVKYITNITSVPAGTVYKLTGGEFIKFAWKESDSASGYTDYTYENGAIIKPSFDLETTTIQDPHSDPATWPSLGQSKFVSIVEIGQEIAKKNISCYWITNDVNYTQNTDGEVVPESYSLFKAGEGEIILGENEYFFYTNTNFNALYTFGSGTRLTRTDTTKELTCKYGIDTEKVVEVGVSALDDFWVKLDYDITITDMQIVSAGEDVVIKFASSETITPGTTRLGYTPLTITSAKVGENTVLNERVTGNPGDEWKLSVLLYLDTTNGAQQLATGQSIVLTDTTEPTPTTSTINSPNYVNSSLPLSILGGEDINVSWIDGEGDTQYLSFQAFEETPIVENSGIERDGDDIKLDVQEGDGTTEYSLTLQLPVGNYILPIFNNTSIESLVVSYGGTSLNQISGKQDILGYLYYELNSSDGTAKTLTIDWARENNQDAPSVEYLYVSPLYRYKKTPGGVTPKTWKEENDILDAVIALDKKAGYKFDYTYQVNSDTKIDNPLLAQSFFDVNHIYNKYTIAKIENLSQEKGKTGLVINITNVAKR